MIIKFQVRNDLFHVMPYNENPIILVVFSFHQ